MGNPSEDTCEAAKTAANAAVEKQLAAWGFTPEQNAWSHLRGNSYGTVQLQIYPDIRDQSRALLQKWQTEEPVDTSYMTPALASQLAVSHESSSSEQQRQDAEAAIRAATGKPSGYEVEKELLSSLRRMAARAVLNVLKQQSKALEPEGL